MMKRMNFFRMFPGPCLWGAALWAGFMGCASCEPGPVPDKGPRTYILEGERQEFRDYCLEGEGRVFFEKLKKEFDGKWLEAKVPDEPQEYGDPDPKKRTSDKVDKWRDAQAQSNILAGVAEAASVFWLVTGEQRYLDKAKEFLLAACRWSTGDPGATRIAYNDEAHFRLWRKLPFVYDQIRVELSGEEKTRVLDSFRIRGKDSFALIYKETKDVKRNSVEEDAPSHPVRFMAMTGLAGLALYDDLPEAKEWLQYALDFYRNRFPPYGGDDGGWAEGSAYWRGNVEHARFQDALACLGSPEAYANPFWRQTGYFPLYVVQPMDLSVFGDTPRQGKFNLEPMVRQMELRLARQFQDGCLRAYADMADPNDRSIETQGLFFSDERYPTGMEYILRDFSSRKQALPQGRPLSELPQGRLFADIGWVSMHSALGDPQKDIMLTFKSSPYGSYSHSHADQNAFILNAYGEGLAINSGYREYHRSEHHKGYTRQTCSKNAVLIDGKGQNVQDKEAQGRILGFIDDGQTLWTAGDATEAYNTGQSGALVEEARRDVVMVDKRYFLIRDRIRLKEAKPVSWVLHAEKRIGWEEASGQARIEQVKAGCLVAVASTAGLGKGRVTDQFPVPVDPKYAAKSPNQGHLTVDFDGSRVEYEICSVFWPYRVGETTGNLELKSVEKDKAWVRRPDGKADLVVLKEKGCEILSQAE
jgi:hypothetical protein